MAGILGQKWGSRASDEFDEAMKNRQNMIRVNGLEQRMIAAFEILRRSSDANVELLSEAVEVFVQECRRLSNV